MSKQINFTYDSLSSIDAAIKQMQAYQEQLTHKCRILAQRVAEIAREIADIMVSSDDLYQIVTLKLLSDGLMKRIRKNYRVIVGFNTGLILLGVGGVLQPTTSALLHNTSTLVISLKSMQNLLS